MVKDYRQIVSGMKSTPWLITEESLAIIVEIVNKHLSGEGFTDEEIKVRIEAADKEERDNPRLQVGGGVGVASIYGPIFPKANLMTEISGATSLETFRSDLKQLVEDNSVQQIVLDVDSPGGAAFMVAETGRAIRAATDVKPVYAVANPVAASGALWLASQATKFYSTESGRVGSLGVYTVHEDISGQDAKLGRKVTFISAGKYKTAGNEHEPLTEEGKAYIQDLVDKTMQGFIEAVAEGRGLSVEKVTDDFANGKVFDAATAKEIGMIDDVASLDEVLEGLVSDNFQSRSATTTGTLANAVNKVHSTITGGELSVATLVSDEEFSEPGQVQDNPDNNRDDSADEGWRRETPPAGEDDSVPNRSATVTNPNKVEGGDMADSAEVTIRKLLGLDEKDNLVEAVTALHEEVKPLRELKQQVDAKRKFEEEYPDEAKRLADLETRNREQFAQQFANSFESRRIQRHVGGGNGNGEGDDVVKESTTLGLSALAIDSIELCAKEFGDGNPTFENFSAMLDAIFDNGIVDYGSKGSEREEERDDDAVVTPGSLNARKLFAEKVDEIQKKDELSYNDALVEAAKRYPNLAEAWRQPPAVVGA